MCQPFQHSLSDTFSPHCNYLRIYARMYTLHAYKSPKVLEVHSFYTHQSIKTLGTLAVELHRYQRISPQKESNVI